jgi:DNA primase
LKNAQPLLTAITAPTTALLLRKEVAALAGVTQAELEALWSVKPIAVPQRQAPQKAKRVTPSGFRILLRCLVMRPELARQLPNDWQGEGSDGAAIAALADWLNESADETSMAALIQHFQGTAHEPVFAVAQGEIMHLGDDFDTEAEFRGILRQLRRDAVDAEIAQLETKGLKMNADEQLRYKQLGEERKQLKVQVS